MTNEWKRTKTSLCAAAMAAGGFLPATALEAGCPCANGGGGGSMAVSAPISGPVYAVPMMAPAYPVSPPPVTTAMPYGGASTNLYPGVQPPPGTLGRTYQLKSRPVPASMHPRTGMIDLKVQNATQVMVHPMNPNLADDRLAGFQDPQDPSMWHFSSEPLIPGLEHIYRIEAQVAGPNGVTMQERYVRLIMGRLIEVTF